MWYLCSLQSNEAVHPPDVNFQRRPRTVDCIQPGVGGCPHKRILWNTEVSDSRCVIRDCLRRSSIDVPLVDNSIYPAVAAVIAANIILLSYIVVAVKEDSQAQKVAETKKNQ